MSNGTLRISVSFEVSLCTLFEITKRNIYNLKGHHIPPFRWFRHVNVLKDLAILRDSSVMLLLSKKKKNTVCSPLRFVYAD